MKKCLVYSDWRQLGFWLAMVGFALVGGFAMGWAWRDRPGALAEVRILDVLIATGTIGAAASAVWVAWWGWRRDNQQRVMDSALAVFGERDGLVRLRLRLSSCLLDIKSGGDGAAGGEALHDWLDSMAVELGKKLHPRYAFFDRLFIRNILDAKNQLEEASWRAIVDEAAGSALLSHLSSASSHLRSAEKICVSAGSSMEKWWA